MNSFTLIAIGNLVRDPERTGNTAHGYTRLCLIGNDPAGRDAQGNPRELVTSVSFVAFGALGESLARNVRRGDQLMLTAQMRNHTWLDKDGVRQYDHSFVVQQFRYGAPGRATRAVRAARDVQANAAPF